MLDIYEAMGSLRAVRRLKPDPVPEDVLSRVLQAATWAPSGGNVQPFRILVVKNREKLQKIKSWYFEEWHKYAAQRRQGLNTLDDVARDKYQKTLKAGDYLADHFQDVPALLVFCYNPDLMAITDSDLGRPSVVGGGSVYPAVQNAMLACRAEGLGCVITTLLCFKEPELKKLLNIPQEWATCAHVPIGYPVLRGHGPITRRPVSKLAFLDEWGKSGFVD